MSGDVPPQGIFFDPNTLPVLEFDVVTIGLVGVLCFCIIPRMCRYLYKLLKLLGILSISGVYAVVASVVVIFVKRSAWVANKIETANAALLACGFPAYIQIDTSIAYSALNNWASRIVQGR